MAAPRQTNHTIIVGAGMGGLAAAIALAAQGERVTLFERAATPGGKMRRLMLGSDDNQAGVDGGPTVFTMRHIFDELLDGADKRLEDYLTLGKVDCLARHAWPDGGQLDLFADVARSADAIGHFAGLAAARQYKRFCADAKAMHDTLYKSFMCQPAPSMKALLAGASVIQLSRTRPFQSLWSALGGYFKDPRLRQLYGRYATYVGSSPFQAPATLMLIAHVEQAGVWQIRGGMHELAKALAAVAADVGVEMHLDCPVRAIQAKGGQITGVELERGECIDADAVIFNGDANAMATGLLGEQVRSTTAPLSRQDRSLSALTWAMNAPTAGFDLEHHNVFFSSDYAREFDELFTRRRLPSEPTVYICAQDRSDSARDHPIPTGRPERMLCIVNAPAEGDGDRASTKLSDEEIERCETATFNHLARLGLEIRPVEQASLIRTSPSEFHQLFPATGGALYGRVSHGWRASFSRTGQRTAIRGLYLAGGSVHPGAGVPMAALSGMTAAASRIADRALTSRSSRVAMSGGTSTG